MGERLLPADTNAERALLGALLLDRDAIIAVAGRLQPAWFYLEKHSWIYEAMLALHQATPPVPPDIATVSDELRRREQLNAVGGIAYLGELSADVPSAVHVEYYAHIVERTAMLRMLIEAGGRITALGYNERDELDETLQRAMAEVQAVVDVRSQQQETTCIARQVASDYYQCIGQAQEPILATTFYDLNRALGGGLRPGDLYVLAARPGVGKTALALNIAEGIAARDAAVLFFSLEMSSTRLMLRMVSARSGIPMDKLIREDFSDDELGLVVAALSEVSELGLHFNDQTAQTVLALQSEARALQQRVGRLDLLVVDYLQLLKWGGTSSRSDNNRVQEVTAIAEALKATARQLDMPVLALSQLSRAVDGRANRVPLLSDLRESGGIEQTADVVLMLYREELYDKDTDKKGIAEIHIAKNRDGSLGVVPLCFDAARVQFRNMAVHHAVEGY